MPRAELRDVWKSYGATAALAGACFDVLPGEVHALLGENGAGKTTLVRALYGLVRPDAGGVWLDGQPVELRGPRDALARGIGLVPQHPSLVPALDVAENLALAESPGASGWGWLPRARLHERARALLARHGLALEPRARVGDLPVGQQQRLEIVRALGRGARLLILDEPTAVLAPAEVDALLDLLRRLRGDGCGVVFISHKLAEVREVCDRVTVLRGGKTVGSGRVDAVPDDELARWMVGHAPPPAARPPARAAAGKVALRLDGLAAAGLGPIDLCVHAGEIVGIAGIDGNGQGPLEELLAGVQRPRAGRVCLERPPLALISGDRQRTGLVLDLSVAENLALHAAAGGREPPFRHGVLVRALLRRRALEALAAFDVRGQPDAPARALSGGNQQKVCVARALHGAPGVLVAIQPTRGLDVEATAGMRRALCARAEAGAGVLLVSTDLDEVLELASRVCVLFRGQLWAVPPEGCTRHGVGAYMLGRGA